MASYKLQNSGQNKKRRLPKMKATYQLIGLPTKNVPEPAHNLSAIYGQAQLE